MGEKTVTINGMVYDRRTGMPLRVERGHDEPHKRSAVHVHATLQRSQTLNRKYVAKEPPLTARGRTAGQAAISVHKPAAAPLVSRSESISRFAREYNSSKQPTNKIIKDIGPTSHPLVRNVHTRTAKPVVVEKVVKPSQVLKHEAISDAMNRAPQRTHKQVKQPTQSRFTRALSVTSGAFAILLLGGYFTYLSMPNLSTRVAAAQAGINASYPAYKPSGYSLSGPVAYDNGNVTMKFAANAGPQNYTLSQSRSGWDSSAVLDNYVEPKAGDQYTTTTSNGLTIYSYGSNAAWVNGGILYTISGDAPLSGDQIQHIATSL
jgi:hypothetical protein